MLLCCCCAFPLRAQYTSTLFSTNLGSKVEFTLMRSYDSSMFYYVRTADSSFFALNTVYDTVAQRAFIPRHYQVSDMEVLGDYAYFCGRNTTAEKGFVGVFHIRNFLSGNATYRICESFYTPPDANGAMSTITDVRRLCVHRSTGTRVHLIAVCSSGTNKNNCILDVEGPLATERSWIYSIGESREPTEVLYDVALTQGYVVTAGSMTAGDGHVALRAYSKGSLFSTSRYQTIYPFSSYDNSPLPSVDFGINDYHITAMGQDTLAVLSTIRRPSATTDVRNGVMFALYDIATMVSQSGPATLYTATLWINDSTGKADVSALRYDSQNRVVAGVVHYETTTSTPTLLHPKTKAWIPKKNMNSTSSTVTVDKGGRAWYQNLDVDAENSRYFAIGWDYLDLFNSKLMLSMNNYGMFGCDASVWRNTTTGYTFAAKEETRPFFVLSDHGVISGDHNPLRVDTMVLQRTCSE